MENKRKRVVLIGIYGYGKTALFNRLTGANIEMYYGDQLTTRNIMLGFSQAESPEKSFEVLDTPGLDCDQNKIQHIAGILAGLQQNAIHRIIFVIKHERTDIIIKKIRSYLQYFSRYQDNITIYVSFFDKYDGDATKEQNIIKGEIEKKLQINSIIFNEKNSTDFYIIQQFNKILEQSQVVYVKLQMDQIIENFDVFDIKDEHKYKLYLGMVTYSRHVQKPIMKFLEKFPKSINDPQYLNYLDVLQDFAKKKVEEQLEKFIQEFGEEMNNQFKMNSDNSQYASYIKLQETLKFELSQIIEKINQKRQLHPEFIGSKIKACPYCGLIWVKAFGCNKILCGDSAGQYDPTLKLQPLVQFEYKIENQQVILVENDIQLFKDKDELIQKLKDSLNNKQFYQIFEKYNIKDDNQFIKLLKKEFHKSCFNQWVQMIDKRKYDDFVQTLLQLLIESKLQPQKGTKGQLGCGNQFYWEYEILGAAYLKAKSLTSKQIAELNDKDLFKISKQKNIEEQKNLSNWLIQQEEKINQLIKKQVRQLKVIPLNFIQQQQQQQNKCRMF